VVLQVSPHRSGSHHRSPMPAPRLLTNG
jgi:hypothetical protein